MGVLIGGGARRSRDAGVACRLNKARVCATRAALRAPARLVCAPMTRYFRHPPVTCHMFAIFSLLMITHTF